LRSWRCIHAGWEKVVYEDPEADVVHVAMSRVTRAPLVVESQPDYPRVAILDPKLREDLAPLLKEQGGARFGLSIVSTDGGERRMVVAIGSDTQRRTYLVDRQAARTCCSRKPSIPASPRSSRPCSPSPSRAATACACTPT
jgi:hypothetical protein